MWSSDTLDLQNLDLVVNHQKIIKTVPTFEPNPYTFTKLESGKTVVADSTSFTPPSWLLLDHSIAVIWTMFSLSRPVQQLSTDDLKWAYKFLKGVKNKKGDNPPDVKVCLREIQDRLIDLYAKLTSFKEGDFNDITSVFGDKIMDSTNTDYSNTSYVEDKLDTVRSSKNNDLQRFHSCKDIPDIKALISTPKNGNRSLENDSVFTEDATDDDEEVEKYVLSLLEEDKKELAQTEKSAKSLIPTKKKGSSIAPSEAASSQDANQDVSKKEKASKRVHCVAEMRSLKFQKSTKVTDRNGEEAAYSNLKAEIQRLTINPDVSRNEVFKFFKDWRSEQFKRLHKEIKSLGNIKELMRSLQNEEIKAEL